MGPSKNGMEKLMSCVKLICILSILGFLSTFLYGVYAWDTIQENVVGYMVIPVAIFLALWGVLTLQLKLGLIKPYPMFLIALAFLLFGVIVLLRLLTEQVFLLLPFGNGIILGASVFLWRNRSRFLS